MATLDYENNSTVRLRQNGLWSLLSEGNEKQMLIRQDALKSLFHRLRLVKGQVI